MANLWERLAAILPNVPLRVGTVLTTYGDDTCLLQLPGGVEQTRVRNGGFTPATGQNFYFKDNVLQSEAPALGVTELETP